MAIDDALDKCQANARALELSGTVQALEDTE